MRNPAVNVPAKLLRTALRVEPFGPASACGGGITSMVILEKARQYSY